MDNITRRDVGFPYIADDKIVQEMSVTKKLIQQFNTMDCCDIDGQQKLMKQILGHVGENCFILQPFHCD